MVRRVFWPSLALAALMLAGGTVALDARAQELVPRPSPRAGAIVSTKGGEEFKILREALWRPALVRQDVVAGDTLRTGAIGTLGVTFADQTTIRIGSQSTLVVNEVAAARGGDTNLTLSGGTAWARAARGGSGVTVRTPAASASIRGTDWALSVAGDETSIVVLEGVVDFTNPQGSVTLRQGEAASARVGERPTRTVLVRPNDREQMLFYIELRGLFRSLPATNLDGAERRDARRRLAAITLASRSTDDWIAIAENGFGQDPRALVEAAVAEARRRLAGTANARLDLVEALIAANARRYPEAASLFARAERGTGGRQQATARCGAYAAATLAEPGRVLPMPPEGDADQNVCLAYVTGFGTGLENAAAILQRSARANPGHRLTGLLSAQVALLLDRRDEMRAIVERMRATDPDSPETLQASGYLRVHVDGDPNGAVADFRRGLAIAPGDSELWNGLGLAEGERDALRESEEAFRRAVEADPHDPVAYTNLAVLLLDQSRLSEADALIERALSLDPSLEAAYTAKGRALLQKGEPAAASEFLLAGSAANPASAQSLLAVAIAQYQSGDRVVAAQALDNADRLDPNDPVTSIARTAIAIDGYQPDEAITAAREAVRRYRNRGSLSAGLASTRTGGSYLGQAYRFLSLEEWGRYYTDRVADPFSATSYFDQAAAQRPRPLFARPTLDQVAGNDFSDVAGTLAIQGLLLDPLAASGRIGRIDLLRRPFLDIEVGGGFVRRNGHTGWQQDASLQTFSNGPVPTAVSLTAARVRTGDPGSSRAGGEDSQSASLFVGMAPSAADRFLLWGTANGARPDILAPEVNDFDSDRSKLSTYQAGAGWSHTLGYRNVLTAAAVASRGDQSQTRVAAISGFDPIAGPFWFSTREQRDAKVDSLTAALGHSIGWGLLTLRSGLEGTTGSIRGFLRDRAELEGPLFPPQIAETFSPVRSDFRAGRGYANLTWQPSDRLQIEGGLFVLHAERDGLADRTDLDPRFGIAVSPLEGHWLRGMWRRDTELPIGFTLSPVTTVGLVPNALPVQLGGRKDTTSLRWDAEWSPRFFTSVEYQNQRARTLSVGIPDTLDSFDLPRARIDYLTATANVWLTHGFGAFGTVGMASSKTVDLLGREADVPYVPRHFARAGITFVHPSRIRLSLVQNVIGPRDDSPGGIRLDTVYTTDATLSYETPDRRFLFGLSLLNAFDADYDMVAARPGSIDAIPGAGRSLLGTVRVRF